MKSWLNRGAGFAPNNADSRPLPGNKSTQKAHLEGGSDGHTVSHSSMRQKDSDWKQEEFLSTFSIDRKHTASPPDNQVIDWSASSSDNDDQQKVKVKKELTEGDKHNTIHHDSCHVKRGASQRRRKQSKFKKNVHELPLSRMVSWMNNQKYGEGFKMENQERVHYNSAEFGQQESLKTLLPFSQYSLDGLRNEDNVSHATKKSVQSKSDCLPLQTRNVSAGTSLNKWTSSTFNSTIPGRSPQVMKGKRKRHHKETCVDRNLESPQLDIEDCMSSSSDFEGNEEMIQEDGDDDDDDDNDEGKGREEKIKCRLGNCDTGRGDRSMDQNFDTDAVKVGKLNGNWLDVTSPPSEAFSIQMSESSMSDNSQVQICGVSTPDSCLSSRKMGASDWASIFQRHTSPPRDCQTVPLNEDSGKKKKKFASKSLTGQLARLVSREQASIRFWNHSVNTDAEQGTSKKCLEVKMNAVVRQFSFLVGTCEILGGQCPSSSACKILFSRNVVDKLNLITGMRLKIFPPWQQLDDGKEVYILCTNYVQVLPPEAVPLEGQPTDPSTSLHSQTTHSCLHDEMQRHVVHLTWSCPCSQDMSLTIAGCPASKSEFSPLALVRPRSSPPSPRLFTLHSITSSAPLASSSTGHHRTLLESIEKAYQNGDCLPPFSAVVLRVIRLRGDQEGKTSLMLLLEDMAGTLAVALHSENTCGSSSGDSTFTSMMKVERKQCLCRGLSVQTRVSTEKDPPLFDVMSQCWLQRRPTATSQDSAEQASQGFQLKVPRFYYILQPLTTDLPKFDPIDDQPKQIKLAELEQAAKGLTGRFSSLGVLLDLQNISKSSESKKVIVLDPLVGTQHSTLYQLILPEDCVNVCLNKRRQRVSICLLRDVCCHDGAIHCDKYSSIIAQSMWRLLGVEETLDKSVVGSALTYELRLPPLTFSALHAGDVFSVEGCISKADEESSYSWEACDKCGTEIMHISDNKRNFCSSCQKSVEAPVSRVKMTVMLEAEQFPKGVIVKLDLNEATIQSILPSETDEEGYDVDQVLGKTVKAAVCVVRSFTPSLVTLEQLDV